MLRDMSESHDKFSGHLPYAASIQTLSATSYKEPISKWFQPGPAPDQLNQNVIASVFQASVFQAPRASLMNSQS